VPVMPVRISARSLDSDPLRNAATPSRTVTSCKYPALPASFCYRKTRQNLALTLRLSESQPASECAVRPVPRARVRSRKRSI
jgi:hypothetical protein